MVAAARARRSSPRSKKTTTRWAAAVDGSQSAASLELATGGQAVMAIGGFTGSDPAPTLAQFKADLRRGRRHHL